MAATADAARRARTRSRRRASRRRATLRGARARSTTRSSRSSIAPARPRSRTRSRGAASGVRDDAEAAVLAAGPRSSKRIAAAIAAQRDEFARTIALEAGKPIKTARVEADRAAFTFTVAAEEAKRIYGEIVPLDWLPGNEGRFAHVRRVPLGPVAGITPFNFPLNLVAHKVAPALAAGNPIVLRPASQTPISSFKLAPHRPRGRLARGRRSPSCRRRRRTRRRSSRTPRIKLLTFTGSPPVGWSLKSRAGCKRVTLELGGNAAVIVHADADADYAAERIVWGGTTNAGQTCISVQRVYVHDSLDGLRGRPRRAASTRSSSATRSTRRPTSAR